MLSRLNKFYFFLLLLPIFLFNLSLPARAEIVCDGQYTCILTEENDDGIDFFMRNILSYDTTISIDFTTLKNVRANVTLPYTKTIPGNSTVKVLTLKKLDSSQGWDYYFKFHWIEGSMEAKHDDSYVYTLPYAPGQTHRVTQGFNGKFSHYGDQKFSIDWEMPEGTEIYAARDGVVVGIKSDSTKGGADKSFAYSANYIMIKHSDGTFGAYLHLKKDGVKVKAGQLVKAGDLIGLSGNTGWSSDPHLHFWVFKALSSFERESFPIRFKTEDEDGAILQEGEYYTAP
jgi:murein DD-endopeptidase MepM/ murein hydrolase activator NlpD